MDLRLAARKLKLASWGNNGAARRLYLPVPRGRRLCREQGSECKALYITRINVTRKPKLPRRARAAGAYARFKCNLDVCRELCRKR